MNFSSKEKNRVIDVFYSLINYFSLYVIHAVDILDNLCVSHHLEDFTPCLSSRVDVVAVIILVLCCERFEMLTCRGATLVRNCMVTVAGG